MKVEINDVNRCNIMEVFGSKLEAIGIKLVKQDDDTNARPWYTVEIDTVEQVFAIEKAVGYELIVNDDGWHGIPELMIFDDYL